MFNYVQRQGRDKKKKCRREKQNRKKTKNRQKNNGVKSGSLLTPSSVKVWFSMETSSVTTV